MPRTPTQLRIAIAASGRTQREIAAAVGLSEKDMSLIVNGHQAGDDATRSKLAGELGTTTSVLFPSSPEVADAA